MVKREKGRERKKTKHALSVFPNKTDQNYNMLAKVHEKKQIFKEMILKAIWKLFLISRQILTQQVGF